MKRRRKPKGNELRSMQIGYVSRATPSLRVLHTTQHDGAVEGLAPPQPQLLDVLRHRGANLGKHMENTHLRPFSASKPSKIHEKTPRHHAKETTSEVYGRVTLPTKCSAQLAMMASTSTERRASRPRKPMALHGFFCSFFVLFWTILTGFRAVFLGKRCSSGKAHCATVTAWS